MSNEEGVFEVPYLPFLDSTNRDPDSFPGYVRQYLDLGRLEAVPGPGEFRQPRSVLRLYLNDVEWLILPEAHHDAEGYSFTNFSFYTNEDAPAALSADLNGISRSTISMGQVRQLAGLAHSIWQVLVPIFGADGASRLPAVAGLDTGRLLSLEQTVSDDELDRIIGAYPAFLGLNLEWGTSVDSEFVLFGDMLRFAWCHEWFHGLAGHCRAMNERFGLADVGEIGTSTSEGDAALVRRAFEFEADAITTNLLMHQLLTGRDMPGRLVSWPDRLDGRIALFVLALSTMMTMWDESDRGRALPDRSHPPAALRYLRVWDTVVERLVGAGQQESVLAVSGTAASAVFDLGSVAPRSSRCRR